MRQRYRVVAASVLMLVVLAAAAAADRGQIAANEAVITSMYGDVTVRHGAAGYRSAKLNEVLSPGDGVKTGADSRAELTVADGGYVRMAESSQVLVTAVDAGGTTTFEAVVGGVWVTIERALSGASRFEVRMPSAVASVKGTVFRCEVDEEGDCDAYVYEGEVEIQAGDERLRVQPEHHCRIPRNLRAAVERFSLAGDDEATWVMYNRHRDIVAHLGNPQIIVGLREHDLPTGGGYAASQAIGAQLALHGLPSASLADLDASEVSLSDDGTIRWRREPPADYCLVGDVTLEDLRDVNGRLFSARVRGDVRLVRDGESRALTSIEALVPGIGRDRREAVGVALTALGRRVGAGLAPRIIRELMHEKTDMIRIDIGGGSREQIAALRRIIGRASGVLRTAPLVLPGDRISLAVITEMSAEELATLIRGEVGDTVERMLAAERVIHLRFKPGVGSQRPVPRRPRPVGGQ